MSRRANRAFECLTAILIVILSSSSIVGAVVPNLLAHSVSPKLEDQHKSPVPKPTLSLSSRLANFSLGSQDTVILPTKQSAGQPTGDGSKRVPAFMSMPSQSGSGSQCGSGSGLSNCGDLTYHNGPVMHNPADFLIFWLPPHFHYDNSTIDPTATNPSDTLYEQLIMRYFFDICQPNPFYSIIQQYPDSGSIGTCSLGGSWIDTLAYPGGRGTQSNPLSDADIQNEVLRSMTANGWTPNAGNSEFFVFTGYGVTSCAGSLCSVPSGGYCGWHSSFTQSGSTIVYATMPDTGTFCSVVYSPNKDIFADSVINTASHEQFESFTDPVVGTGWYYQDTQREIADECNFTFGRNDATLLVGTDYYRVQQEWSNAVHGCQGLLGGQWEDSFETYTCSAFPSSNWILRYAGAGSSRQYVDCTTASLGAESFHLQGQSGFSAVADRSFALSSASVIGYTLFVKTGSLGSTSNVACDTSFYVPGSNVAPARVQFFDNGKIMPGNVAYSAGNWNKVAVTVNMTSNTFHLHINDNDVGSFTADLNGNGSYLSQISSLALMSDWAGRECWFDDVVTTTASFNFFLAASPGAGNVIVGGTNSATVTTTLVSGSSESIAFSISGTPSGVTAAFSIPSCRPTCTSTLTFTASTTATTGSFTLTITAVGGGIAHSSAYSLTVTSPTYPIILDANSVSATDANPQVTNTVVKTFNVGAIIEANSTTPLNGVWGWEFSIIYDNTTVVPQGDPSSFLPYLDGAAATVSFGAMTATGQVSWAGKIQSSQGFGTFAIVDIDKTHREIQVFFVLIAPSQSVNIGPVVSGTVKGNLLASIAFELIRKPSSAVVFSLDPTNSLFVDITANRIPGIVTGPAVTETITNIPPVASFKSTLLRNEDTSCVPVTGSPCSSFALKFDATASSDSDGSIANPQGYFWDFGDGTQDSINNPSCGLLVCNQGSIAVHDYGSQGNFNVTLRVVDSLGATGSARDLLGNVIINGQPSHASHVIPASSGQTINPLLLDAHSTGPTDANPQTSDTVVKTFNVGVIIEANSTTPINGVYGWEFSIIYDNTTVVPQGDPSAFFPYPDGAAPTINFGAMTGTGQVSWGSKIQSNQGFGTFVIVDIDNTHREIQVFFTLLAPSQSVNIGPVASGTVKGNLLASIAFELIRKPSSAVVFSLDPTNSKFVDINANSIPGIVAGSPASVTISNAPPTASFVSNPLPAGDSSCAPITGVPCSGYAFSFDGSASSDADGSIMNPEGYFWDFGDGTQDSVNACCAQGAVAIHDYGTNGTFDVTLRVIDNLGATGSARDQLGTVIYNLQPGHIDHLVKADRPPVAMFTESPTSGLEGDTITFDSSTSFDPDGSIVNYTWAFGDGAGGIGSIIGHSYSAPGIYTVTLTVEDNNGNSASATSTVTVNDRPPTVGFIPDRTTATRLDAITITYTSSDDEPVASVTVDWGDGAVHSRLPATGTDRHTYASLGSYLLKVTAIGSDGLSSLASVVITVTDVPPSACFTENVSTARVGTTISFDASCSSDVDGTITGYSWDFGDGSPLSSGLSVSHAYVQGGAYPVRLTVIDNDGSTGMFTSTVAILHPAITLTKTAHATVSGSGTTAVTYDYQVCNTGNTPLTVDLDDNLLGTIVRGAHVSQGACNDYGVNTSLTSSTTNTATATGVDKLGDTVTATATATVTVTAVQNGEVKADQTSITGVNTTITGSMSSNGTPVSVASTNLGNIQPSSTATINLGSIRFYDLQVNGTSTGTARVCITDQSVSAGILFDFWSSTTNGGTGVWVNLANVTITGYQTCGDIPVSGLDGTPLVIGRMYPGDVNMNGLVDITDLVLVARIFGSELGDQKYAPMADLNQDGVIDISDLVIVASHFGFIA